ncbi:MAG: hypothetical protein A3H35_05390 [Betaproteobacteria bacterium RIFCSPLOWO2_02_FULL_62_17]|nr:MAG: hypothetical protein A3H35_05390 [Betaproteobacteria bacterium RIFCSPLOWO2_02_FULL_62_17]
MQAVSGRVDTALTQFQNDFARALLDPFASPAASIAPLAHQPGFAVYRNTVMKACIDALQANYPAVARLVGEEWFRAAAAIFVRKHPPAHAALVDYGAAFAAFLAAFPPAAELSYLAGVAALDRFWSECHTARDEPPLAAAALADLDADTLGATVLRPHAAARWQWFADQPIATLWQANRAPQLAPTEAIEWHGEGMLLVRPGSAVTWLQLDHSGIAFLDACSKGQLAGEAAQAALHADASADLAKLLSRLLEAGAFAGTPDS